MDKCRCVQCGECGGSGIVWYSFTGEYLGNHRSDDLDDLDTCPECHGLGIDGLCSYCEELLHDEDEAA